MTHQDKNCAHNLPWAQFFIPGPTGRTKTARKLVQREKAKKQARWYHLNCKEEGAGPPIRQYYLPKEESENGICNAYEFC
jgi:hypothetical protein